MTGRCCHTIPYCGERDPGCIYSGCTGCPPKCPPGVVQYITHNAASRSGMFVGMVPVRGEPVSSVWFV